MVALPRFSMRRYLIVWVICVLVLLALYKNLESNGPGGKGRTGMTHPSPRKKRSPGTQTSGAKFIKGPQAQEKMTLNVLAALAQRKDSVAAASAPRTGQKAPPHKPPGTAQSPDDVLAQLEDPEHEEEPFQQTSTQEMQASTDPLEFTTNIPVDSTPALPDGDIWSLGVENDDIDSRLVELPPLDPSFKNPCWYERLPDNYTYEGNYYASCPFKNNSRPRDQIRGCFNRMEKVFQHRRNKGLGNWRLRCFPYYFVIGVTKCGTTYLCNAITELLPGHVKGGLKEYHYWDQHRYPQVPKKCPQEPKMRFSTYLDAIDEAAEVIRRNRVMKDGMVYHPFFTGDCTPSTMMANYKWDLRPGNRGMPEPYFTTANYIATLAPQTKILFILRDPIERFYSNFLMKVRQTVGIRATPRAQFLAGTTFLEVAQAAVHKFHLCERKYNARKCVYDADSYDFYQMLVRGIYVVFVEDWLQLYPREQFLFFRNEDFRVTPLTSIEKVVDFLGTDPLKPEDRQKLADKEAAAQEAGQPSTHDMKDEDREFLQNFFHPYNQRLAEVLEDEGYTWGY